MKSILKILFPLIAATTLFYIWSVSIQNNGGLNATFNSGDAESLIYNLLKLAGLTAFTLVGFQVLTGPYMKFWEYLYGQNFYRYHAFQGIFTLVFALLHPILLLLFLKLANINIFEFSNGQPYQYYFGSVALILMLFTVTTAISNVLLKKLRFTKKWHYIHFLNYGIFILVFAHSMTIGTDVSPKGSSLKIIWVFFFIGAVVGFIYRRIYRVIREKREQAPQNSINSPKSSIF